MAQPLPVASLPMYDWPELRWAHDALWAAMAKRLRQAGIAAPERLDRSRPMEDVWLDPGLVLSQTCGWPFATRLRAKVRLVATPVYAVEGCEGPLYSSMIVVRRSERATDLAGLEGRRFALNTRESLSGFVALAAALRQAGLDPDATEWIETGSHRQSVRAVAAGRADVAAVDAICWTLAKEFESEAAGGLSVIGRTPLRPGLPLITSAGGGDVELGALRAALRDALASSETDEARKVLFLAGSAVVEEADYLALNALAG